MTKKNKKNFLIRYDFFGKLLSVRTTKISTYEFVLRLLEKIIDITLINRRIFKNIN
jgi:hypothetical protein